MTQRTAGGRLRSQAHGPARDRWAKSVRSGPAGSGIRRGDRSSVYFHLPGHFSYQSGWNERNKPGGDGSLGEFALPVIDILDKPFHNERL